MAQAFVRETYAVHNAPPDGRLGVGVAMPNKLADRVALSDLLLRRDGLTLFGDIRLYHRDAIKPARHGALETSAESDLSLLHRYVRNDRDPARLNGDFAFGSFDESKRSLSLVRDPIGNRFVHWAQRPKGLAISTRVHCFFEIDIDRSNLGPTALATSLASRFPGAGRTCYRSINELEPAHRLRTDRMATRFGTAAGRWSRMRTSPSNATTTGSAKSARGLCARRRQECAMPKGPASDCRAGRIRPPLPACCAPNIPKLISAPIYCRRSFRPG